MTKCVQCKNIADKGFITLGKKKFGICNKCTNKWLPALIMIIMQKNNKIKK